MIKKFILLSCLAAFVAAPLPSLAHSGGTDKNGCHTNRKTGDYHCHNKKRTERVYQYRYQYQSENEEIEKEKKRKKAKEQAEAKEKTNEKAR